MKEKLFNLKQLKNRPKKTDLEKDLRNPARRVVRHTILSKKYGDMQHHHMDATDYHLEHFKPLDIDQIVQESEKKMDEYLAEQQKRDEATAKKAEREAEKEKKKAEREAKKAAKQAAKDVTTEAESEDQEKTVNGVGSMKKGDDGLYHYQPVIFHDDKKKK